MARRQILRFGVAILLCVTIFGFSNHRGSATVDLEDRKIEAFVDAAMAVDGVMASWRPKIARASDSKAEDLRRQANREIRETIDDVDGISFTEYRDIRRKIAADPEMLDRVTAVMRQRDRH